MNCRNNSTASRVARIVLGLNRLLQETAFVFYVAKNPNINTESKNKVVNQKSNAVSLEFMTNLRNSASGNAWNGRSLFGGMIVLCLPRVFCSLINMV